MNNIIPFDFEARPVRVIDHEGQPWFVLADICRILELANPSKAAASLDDDERYTLTNLEGIAAPQVQQMTVINESGLYKLILRSRKGAAKRFTKWITSRVLPSIRRSGSYGAPAPALDLSDPATLQTLLIDLTGRTLDASARISQLQPKAEALERITGAKGSMCVTDAAKVLSVPPRRLVAWMEANKWVYRRADAGSLVAFGTKIGSGMLEHKGTTIQRRGHPDKWVQQVMVTPKGIARLAELRAGQ